MNLLSCEHCGGVFDKDRISEPEMYDKDGYILSSVAAWDSYHDRHCTTITCRICGQRIFYHNGDSV